MKLLLVEDEPRMAQPLCELLRMEHYEVEHISNGIDAENAILSRHFDVIIMDIMLPGKDGFSVTQSVRNKGIHTPILMLTAKGDLDEKVEGLDCGADDYMTKPFLSKELLARLRALCRRNQSSAANALTFGDILLDTGSAILTCTANGQSIRLSEKEFRILEYLIMNRGQIISREQFAVRIWGYENEAEYNNVEVYMTFTRKKMAFVGSKTEIKAVRGIGYELRY